MKQLAVYIFTLWFFAGCANQPQEPAAENRTIRIVYTDWSEAVALTHLAEILLEDEMEYEVETKLTDVENAYKEVANGEADVFPDAWLPETHRNYYHEYSDKLMKLGIIYPGARTGLVVPDYSRYSSIEDLQNESFHVLGIDSGAGIMRQTRHAIESYNLQAALKNLSEEEMTEQFSEEYKRRNEVVITGWEPHWLFAQYEVRFLDDPMSIFGKKENIFALGTSNLDEKHPHVVRFFERMQLSEKQINSLIYFMNSDENPESGVREWIDQNEYVVNQWVKDLKPERKKIM